MTGPQPQRQPEPAPAAAPQTITLDAPAPQAVGHLSPQLEGILKRTQALLAEAELSGDKGRNLAAAEIGKLGWGKNLEERTRRALADWAHRYQVDISTEVYVLGSNIYLGAAFYLRKLGELVHAGLVEYAYPDYVHHDERLQKIADTKAPEGLTDEGLSAWNARRNDALAELHRREDARIEFGIPEASTGAVVFRVKLKTLDRETTGANWCGGNTAKKSAGGGMVKTGKEADPIGELEPVKTAASRAARRCLRQVISHVPMFAKALQAAEADAERLGVVIGEEKAKHKAEVQATAALGTTPVSTADL